MKYQVVFLDEQRDCWFGYSSHDTHDEAVKSMNKCLDEWGIVRILDRDEEYNKMKAASDRWEEMRQLRWEILDGAYDNETEEVRIKVRKRLAELEEEFEG